MPNHGEMIFDVKLSAFSLSHHPSSIVFLPLKSVSPQFGSLPMCVPHTQNSWCKFSLRGYCTFSPQNSMFCPVSQNYQHLFWKIIYASYSKLSKELKNSIKIKVDQAVLELLTQTTFLLFWSITWKLLVPLKFQCHFFNSLNNLL